LISNQNGGFPEGVFFSGEIFGWKSTNVLRNEFLRLVKKQTCFATSFYVWFPSERD